MKQLIFILLIFLLPFSIQAKKILLYEYNEGDCYYSLELDTLHNDGRFCAVNCYDQLNVLEIYFSLWRPDQETFSFTSNTYFFSKYRIDTELQLYIDTTDLINKDFFFSYKVKNNWQHLEYAHFHFDYDTDNRGHFSELGQKKARLSPFFKENGVFWFPPSLVQVKKIDYDRFPKEYRKEIKKRKLK